MSHFTPKLKKIEKYISVNLVKDTVTQLVEFKIKNGGRVPHYEVNKYFDGIYFVHMYVHAVEASCATDIAENLNAPCTFHIGH